MGNLGGGEILVILLLGLLVLGPQRLPVVGRQVGRVVTQIRRASRGFQEEFRSALGNPLDEAEARARGAKLLSEAPSVGGESGRPVETGNSDEPEVDY